MNRRRHETSVAFVFAATWLQTVTASAATYYVATNGDDDHSCAEAQAESTPRQTIQGGVDCLAGGDTLIVKAGTYTGQGVLNPPPGTENAYTVIMGDPNGARPVLKPDASDTQRGLYCGRGDACSYIEWAYFEVDGAYEYVKLDGTDASGYPHHVTIKNNVFHDSKNSGFVINSSNFGFIGGDHLIQGNEFYRTGSGTPNYGPGANNIYNPGNRTIVEGNVFHDGANGVGIWRSNSEGTKDVQNVIVRGNVFYDMGRTTLNPWLDGAFGYTGVHVSVPGGGHRIYNNVFYRSCENSSCRAFRVNMYGSQARIDASTPIHIYNNTIYDLLDPNAVAIKIEPNMGGPHLVSNNIAYLAGGGIAGGIQSNNILDDPLFVDAAANDFRTLPESPAIDAGLSLEEVDVDFAGVPRPLGSAHDIGAFESCVSDDQCDDRDACTSDACAGGACQSEPVTDCCMADDQCDDDDPCTQSTCSNGMCQHTPLMDCCESDDQCDEACTSDEQCNDSDPCTNDACLAGSCQHTSADQCNDDDSCVTDSCDTGGSDDPGTESSGPGARPAGAGAGGCGCVAGGGEDNLRVPTLLLMLLTTGMLAQRRRRGRAGAAS